jgi:hypothetical protein
MLASFLAASRSRLFYLANHPHCPSPLTHAHQEEAGPKAATEIRNSVILSPSSSLEGFSITHTPYSRC